MIFLPLTSVAIAMAIAMAGTTRAVQLLLTGRKMPKRLRRISGALYLFFRRHIERDVPICFIGEFEKRLVAFYVKRTARMETR